MVRVGVVGSGCVAADIACVHVVVVVGVVDNTGIAVVVVVVLCYRVC